MELSFSDIQEHIDVLIELAIAYVPKLLLALLTLFIGFKAIALGRNALRKTLEAKSIDPSLVGFVASLFEMSLKVMLAISAAGMIGIEMTSFIAVLGAAGLAVGMALSGTLQNFAGGVLILILKPYKVGDFIEAGGHLGTVKEILIFNTILTSPDNKRIIIPNSKLANDSLVNYSAEPTRRIEWIFGIGYDDDIDKAKGIVQNLLDNHEMVLKDPEIYIGLSQLADSSVNFTVRAWVESGNFLAVSHGITEQVKKSFDREGISIPYPQRTIHMEKAS